MIDYKKINDVMCWDTYEGETDEDAFVRRGGRADDLPANEIIDIVHSGGLQTWAESLDVPSQEALYHKVLKAIRKTVSDPVFQDTRRIKSFPPFANFFYYCQKVDRNGGLHKETTGLTNVAWNGVICRRNIKVNTEKMFANPDKSKYIEAATKVKEVYKYTDNEIEALRYFVCQTRHDDHNPSLNKSIYHWGDDKKTGKTTVAKIIVAILNGDTLKNAGTYSSKLNRELQYNKHDVPKAALYNAVYLDEVMPKDSRKSYGAFKAMLTDDSCDFDPKFKDIVTVPCKRFYYFTSNDDIADVIQDAKERRLIAIHSIEKPTQMSFEDIYQLWYDFCTNSTPEDNWQRWYDSFAMVDGLATKDLNEIKNEIINNVDELFGVSEGTYTTVKKIASKLFKNEPTREQKKSVGEAMNELFHSARLPSNMSNYTVSTCRHKIAEIDNGDNNLGDVPDTLPF